eukprot:jgi/Hompol1/5422/HPOL_004423-RA
MVATLSGSSYVCTCQTSGGFQATPSTGVLYPIPVRIANYRLSTGVQPDLGASTTDWTGTQLFRRFFLVDTASGVLNGKTSIIRIASQIAITITKSSNPGSITLPIVDITYTERDVSTLSATDASIYSSPQITFSVSYLQDFSNIRQVLTVLFAIFASASIIYAFYLSRLWNTRNLGPYDAIDIKLLVTQCTAHVFFVDWERSRGRVVSPGNDPSTATGAPISVWRSIFMANQWNALQTYQRIQIEFTLIALLVILEGLGFRYMATAKSGFKDLSADTVNPFLLVAVDSMWWIVLIVSQ